MSTRPTFNNLILDRAMHVASGGVLGHYISQAIEYLDDHETLVIKGSGHAITQAVSIAEVIKRRIPDLHQLIKIDNLSRRPPQSPDDAEVGPPVASISITLSRSVLDTEDPGYQAPVAAAEVVLKPRLSKKPKKARHTKPRKQSVTPPPVTPPPVDTPPLRSPQLETIQTPIQYIRPSYTPESIPDRRINRPTGRAGMPSTVERLHRNAEDADRPKRFTPPRFDGPPRKDAYTTDHSRKYSAPESQRMRPDRPSTRLDRPRHDYQYNRPSERPGQLVQSRNHQNHQEYDRRVEYRPERPQIQRRFDSGTAPFRPSNRSNYYRKTRISVPGMEEKFE